MILPDTNIIIAYFKGIEPAFSLLEHAIETRTIGFSVISSAEFLIRATEKETALFNQVIEKAGVISIDLTIMEKAVDYRKAALTKTKRILLLDCFIAATAKLHNATLLTYDKRDYPFTGVTVKTPEEIAAS